MRQRGGIVGAFFMNKAMLSDSAIFVVNNNDNCFLCQLKKSIVPNKNEIEDCNSQLALAIR